MGPEQDYSRQNEELEAGKSRARKRDKKRRAGTTGTKKRTLKGKDRRKKDKECDINTYTSQLHIRSLTSVDVRVGFLSS